MQGIHLFRERLNQTLAQTHAGRRATAAVLSLAMLPLAAPAVWAQQPGASQDYGVQGAPYAYQPLQFEQLDQLVAPIALYPDSLVAQILAASTYPAQVVSAQQFINQNGNYAPGQLAELANTQPWDPSVKSLVAFPNVVNDLNSNMEWTTALGNAYYNQPQDVMSAVQQMRQRAYAAGNLRTTPQIAVAYNPGAIVIAPVSPTVVYVPYYNPWGVYGAPVPVYTGYRYYQPRGVSFASGLGLGFAAGVVIGAFTHYSWGYHSWRPNWESRTVVYNRTTYISNSRTVINHGNYGRYDQGHYRDSRNRLGNAGSVSRNRTAINNVTVNRGSNTFNRNSYNRGNNTYDRSAAVVHNSSTLQNGSGALRGPTNAVNRGGEGRAGSINQSRPVGTRGVRQGQRMEQRPEQRTEQRPEQRMTQAPRQAGPARSEVRTEQRQQSRPEQGRQARPQQERGGGHESHGGGEQHDHRR